MPYTGTTITSGTQVWLANDGQYFTAGTPATYSAAYSYCLPQYKRSPFIVSNMSSTAMTSKGLTINPGSSTNSTPPIYVNGTYYYPAIDGYFTSTDLTNWTFYAAPISNACGQIVYGNGVFVMIPIFYYGNTTYYTSTDGVNWTSRNIPTANGSTAGNVGYLYFVNGIFLWASNYSSSPSQYFTSTNGIAWTAIAMPVGMGAMQNIEYGNSTYMTVDWSGNIWYTSSLTTGTWVQPTSNGANIQSSTLPTFGGGYFYIMPLNANGEIAYSSNGVSWTIKSITLVKGHPFVQGQFNTQSNAATILYPGAPTNFPQWPSLVYDVTNSILVAVFCLSTTFGQGYATNAILWSSDLGVTWNSQLISTPMMEGTTNQYFATRVNSTALIYTTQLQIFAGGGDLVPHQFPEFWVKNTTSSFYNNYNSPKSLYSSTFTLTRQTTGSFLQYSTILYSNVADCTFLNTATVGASATSGILTASYMRIL